MEADLKRLYDFSYNIVAADCNAQREVSVPILANRILDVATRHADLWGIGYENITHNNQAWVLARLAIEMEHYPNPYDTLIVETWVEDFNRHFSSRNFCFRDPEGNIYGYARSIWFVIDLITRKSLDISAFEYLKDRKYPKECPIATQGRLRPVTEGKGYDYDVVYSDIDFNRHFNSGKQIEHVLNHFPLEQFDQKRVKRFEINYMNEAHFGDKLEIISREDESDKYTVEVHHKDGTNLICRCKIVFEDR
ncbi:MAG: thioesterase [Bacteroidales bacterium]